MSISDLDLLPAGHFNRMLFFHRLLLFLTFIFTFSYVLEKLILFFMETYFLIRNYLRTFIIILQK